MVCGWIWLADPSIFSALILLGIGNTPADKSHRLGLCLQVGLAASTEMQETGVVQGPLTLTCPNPRHASSWGYGSSPSSPWISAVLVLLVALQVCNGGQGAAALLIRLWNLLCSSYEGTAWAFHLFFLSWTLHPAALKDCVRVLLLEVSWTGSVTLSLLPP